MNAKRRPWCADAFWFQTESMVRVFGSGGLEGTRIGPGCIACTRRNRNGRHQVGRTGNNQHGRPSRRRQTHTRCNRPCIGVSIRHMNRILAADDTSPSAYIGSVPGRSLPDGAFPVSRTSAASLTVASASRRQHCDARAADSTQPCEFAKPVSSDRAALPFSLRHSHYGP
jgi:hypothetical protein